ncbi:uncharacterized protein LOC142774668 [Rhipicephalus microplus]|uniref:uncharacterized protein LOC142774668 n=1 Tax=Rhipicephalus microplus TaxID=6941 RepID=UPI003F6CED83
MGDRTGEKARIASLTACLLALESEADAAKAAKERIKQQLLFSSSLLCALELLEKACNRSIWAFRRNERWFEGTVPHLGEQNFKQSFRVYPSAFRFIVESLRSELERQCASMREAITPEKRVGIALYKLCSSAEDRTVANLFGVGRSTVNTLYRQFCEAVVAVLEHECIKMVTAEEMARHIQEFEAVTGFRQGVGALDGCHFPISPPKGHVTDYYNYRGWYSIILLALVDHRYRFRYINIGAPGRCHDSHVFGYSQISNAIKGPLFKAPLATIAGTVIPPLILCDQAFSLAPSLMP